MCVKHQFNSQSNLGIKSELAVFNFKNIVLNLDRLASIHDVRRQSVSRMKACRRLTWKIEDYTYCSECERHMKNARFQSSETSALDKRNYTSVTSPKPINTRVSTLIPQLWEAS